jgi:hypothetical protein
MTRVLDTDVFGHLAVDREAVVDKKVFARPDAGEYVDEDAIARLDRLAVGRARMVQETGAVPAATAIDDATARQTARQTEHEHMAGLRLLACGGPPPAGHFTRVLDEPLACGDWLKRKRSLAMHGGGMAADHAPGIMNRSNGSTIKALSLRRRSQRDGRPGVLATDYPPGPPESRVVFPA